MDGLWKAADAARINPVASAKQVADCAERALRTVSGGFDVVVCEVPIDVGTTTVLRPAGDLDVLTVDELRETLARVVETGSGDVLVDLADVEHVDIVALSSILAAADALREHDRALRVAGARRDLRRVCALLRAEDILVG